MKRFLPFLIVAIFCLSNEGFAQPMLINAPREYQPIDPSYDSWNSMITDSNKSLLNKPHKSSKKFQKAKHPITAENDPFAMEITTDETTGQSIIKWKDGTIYQGQTNYGEIKGVGTMIYPDKSKYAGSWKRDLPNGKGTFQTPEGIMYTVNFENGVPHGKGIIQDLDGRLYSARWVRGVLKEKSIKPLK